MLLFRSLWYRVSVSALISLCNSDDHQIQRLHSLIDDNDDIFIQTALVTAYGKCRDVQSALKLFESMTSKDTVSLNAIMTALNEKEWFIDSLRLYQSHESLHNHTSHLLALQCAALRCDLEIGQQIESKIDWFAISDRKMRVKFATSLVDLYGNCLEIDSALSIYHQVPDGERDIVLLSAMMEALYHNQRNTECLELFKHRTITADTVCYAIALKTCTQSTAYHFGRTIHCELQQHRGLQWILREIEIQINLIDFYGKCGHLAVCNAIFEDIRINERRKYLTEINLWNAMIHCHGRNGYVDAANVIYDRMEQEQVERDKNTHILMVSACAHSGDLERAKRIWNGIEDEGIQYDSYLVSAMVDCHSRTGHLKEGKELILKYERQSGYRYYEAMWTSLMSGCTKFGDRMLAEEVHNAVNERFDMKQARHLASTAIMLSNIYGAANMFERKNEIREEMRRKGLDKYQRLAISEIDVGDGGVHRFRAGASYRKDAQYREIDDKFEEIVGALKAEYGYIPDTNLITREMNESKGETKEFVLLRHSEKIAAVYGLLVTPKEFAIVINKNLRICSDCHSFMKALSKLTRRQLIVSDTNRVHIFSDGLCNCNDFY